MFEEINLKNIKNKYKIIPKKHLGKNFIFDQYILNKIISNILPIKKFNIIEIGPGPGGLTLAILKNKPKKIILIEKDSSFCRIINKITYTSLYKIFSSLQQYILLNINF